MEVKYTNTDIRILNYIQKNKQVLKKYTINEIAKNSYCSTASVHRMIKKLGYNSFSDLKYEISSTNSEAILNLLSNDYQVFKGVLKEFSNSKNIYFVSKISSDKILNNLPNDCKQILFYNEICMYELKNSIYVIINSEKIDPLQVIIYYDLISELEN